MSCTRIVFNNCECYLDHEMINLEIGNHYKIYLKDFTINNAELVEMDCFSIEFHTENPYHDFEISWKDIEEIEEIV